MSKEKKFQNMRTLPILTLNIITLKIMKLSGTMYLEYKISHDLITWIRSGSGGKILYGCPIEGKKREALITLSSLCVEV